MISGLLVSIVGSIAMAAVPAYFVFQPWAVMRLEGRWRIAAMAPLLVAVPAIAWSLFALSQESNLWPLVFVLFAPFGSIYLVGLLILSRFKSQV